MIKNFKFHPDLFMITSVRDKPPSFDCKQIRVGKRYALDLELNFASSHDTIGVMPMILDPNIAFGYKGTSVLPEQKFGYRIYIANNLNGLCIEEKEE